MNAPESEISEAAVERVVHRSTAHDSAVLHVTGRAVYIDDMVEPTGTLHLAPGFCPDMARGRIRACINEVVAPRDAWVAPGDLVALFPPVSGG